ncbi:Prenylcysteine oxidase [Pseudolycoriella hygida]|uniref:Prenylcysteine oxidase n=1 Tax=Pseudolycoriella hygida TaxID=35572 RepID=A0A9Q0RV70_9DIPT|nr:Prenylcysteine oxidase [Pseudolycoriella hygida]
MVHSNSNILIAFVAIFSPIICTQQQNVKIAIIGGGIGGTSCAYFLNEMFGEKADIFIYEGNKIGGRLATVSMTDGNEYETGGSIIHERNKYMTDFVKDLGLQRRPPSSNERLGLYNGKDFDFIQSDYYLMNVIKMLWRYGYSTVKLQRFISKMLDKFDRIYGLQKEGRAFDNVEDLVAAMNPEFLTYLNVSVKDGYVEKERFSQKIVNELVQASLRCNYGQTVKVPEFVGSVSMAGMDGALWCVSGGNRRVAERLLDESNAKLIEAFALSVSMKQFGYVVATATSNDTYDYVVIATPLSQNQRIPLNFDNLPTQISRNGEYHRTVSTLVLGKLNKKKFPKFADDEGAIIINTNDDDFFNSIGNLQGINGKENHRAWKVFSKKPLTSNEMNILFENHTEVKIIDWLAYPHYVLPHQQMSFSLAPRLYHINAIEWAASAMEMSCIGAKNVALLIRRDHGNWQQTNSMKRSVEEL